MASNKLFRFGPVALTATLTTNLLNPPSAAGGVNAGAAGNYLILRHITLVNKTGAAVTFSLWLGATAANAAGTEVIGQGQSVPANSSFPWYGLLRLDVADFLVGGGSAVGALSHRRCFGQGWRLTLPGKHAGVETDGTLYSPSTCGLQQPRKKAPKCQPRPSPLETMPPSA